MPKHPRFIKRRARLFIDKHNVTKTIETYKLQLKKLERMDLNADEFETLRNELDRQKNILLERSVMGLYYADDGTDKRFKPVDEFKEPVEDEE